MVVFLAKMEEPQTIRMVLQVGLMMMEHYIKRYVPIAVAMPVFPQHRVHGHQLIIPGEAVTKLWSKSVLALVVYVQALNRL